MPSDKRAEKHNACLLAQACDRSEDTQRIGCIVPCNSGLHGAMLALKNMDMLYVAAVNAFPHVCIIIALSVFNLLGPRSCREATCCRT